MLELSEKLDECEIELLSIRDNIDTTNAVGKDKLKGSVPTHCAKELALWADCPFFAAGSAVAYMSLEELNL